MPIKRNSQLLGTTLIELLIIMLVMAVIYGFTSVSFAQWNVKKRFEHTVTQVLEAVKRSKRLALEQGVSHEVFLQGQQIWIKKKGAYPKEWVFDKLSSEVEWEYTRWPSFSPFGFARSGSIILRHEFWQDRIVVSSLGRIRKESEKLSS